MLQRIWEMFGIGKVTLTDDNGDLLLLQITEGAAGKGFKDRITDKVRRIAEFGFASVPPIDSEVLIARRGGDRSMPMVIGTSHRPSRPKNLKPGDTVLYDVRGAKVQMTADGMLIDCAGLPCTIQNATTITIKASEKVHIEAPTVEVKGNLTVSGTVTGLTDHTSVEIGALRDAYNAHHHGGVQTGSGSTGATDHTV